jgi:hypothetical protein
MAELESAIPLAIEYEARNYYLAVNAFFIAGSALIIGTNIISVIGLIIAS